MNSGKWGWRVQVENNLSGGPQLKQQWDPNTSTRRHVTWRGVAWQHIDVTRRDVTRICTAPYNPTCDHCTDRLLMLPYYNQLYLFFFTYLSHSFPLTCCLAHENEMLCNSIFINEGNVEEETSKVICQNPN